MLKKYTDKPTYNSDLAYINTKTAEFFQGCSYQEEIKHPIRDEFYIDLSVHGGNILNTIKEHDQSIINDSWLSTNIIDKLPDDFGWSDMSRSYRLVCDAMKVFNHLTEQNTLGELLLSLMSAFKGQIFTVGISTYIYLANLNPFEGVSVNDLIAGYPDTFLRVENKDQILNINIVP